MMIATSFSLDFLCFVREKVIRERDKNHEKLKVPSKAKNEKEKTKKTHNNKIRRHNKQPFRILL